MKKLENKTALITGCNRGIGKAILEAVVREGASVIACTRVIDDDLLLFYSSLEKEYSVKVYPIQVDMMDEDSVKTAIKEICAYKLPIHILVNNAGVACFDGLMKLSSETLKSVFQVNYFSPLLLLKGVVMPMMKAKGASVINITSVAGMDGTIGNCSYGASKASMILATKTLSKELAKAKVRVNAVAPSIVTTDMSASINDEVLNQQLSVTALGRPSTPDEIAKVVVFLASDESSYITGQIIRVDGGM